LPALRRFCEFVIEVRRPAEDIDINEAAPIGVWIWKGGGSHGGTAWGQLPASASRQIFSFMSAIRAARLAVFLRGAWG
jgi:hypothetical protein